MAADGAAVTSVDDMNPVDIARELIKSHPPDLTTAPAFLGAQFDSGLAWVHFPPGRGGLGISREHQAAVDEVLRGAGAPVPPGESMIGIGMAAPVLVAYGSHDQQERYLRRIFTGEEIWSQLFSEPGAGSDVAGLSTMAVRDGNDWIVDGQKVWTSLAHVASFGLLAARTDSEQPKHAGITYFVIDMKACGVDVRPLRQMTGDAEFNEVFLDHVRIPDTERLGGVGRGWSVMITTLMNERVALGGVIPPRGSGPISDALALWADRGSTDPVQRDRLVKLWMDAECQRLGAIRAAAERGSESAGPDGSLGKLAGALLNQRITDFCVDLLGATGTLDGSLIPDRADGNGTIVSGFLRARANTIEGGTSEVMRNIIGERVLGLPGDVRVDRDIPWRELPRN